MKKHVNGLSNKDWKARLLYNINELNDSDSLLQYQILKASEQEKARLILGSLSERELQSGLVHGDLAPRNVLVDGNSVYLLDWGCAEINVVPHIEIGILQMSDECSDQDLDAYLKGYGISLQEYQSIADEIKILKFLHHLDKYRWAEGRQLKEIAEYRQKVRDTFEELPDLF